MTAQAIQAEDRLQISTDTQDLLSTWIYQSLLPELLAPHSFSWCTKQIDLLHLI